MTVSLNGSNIEEITLDGTSFDVVNLDGTRVLFPYTLAWTGLNSAISSDYSGTVTSTLRFTNKGLWDHLQGINDGSYTTPDYTDTSIAYGDYTEIKVTVLSGDTPTGSATGVWLDAGSILTFSLSYSGSEGASSATLEIRARKKSDLVEVVINPSFFLSAQKILP